ncbi:uncharacterized protein LOC116337012 [Contarinia nasturtii]|uniref:uncharacterized protein LOC116337012 n=1 Tax=Contarinia nasturtii TaxID=265458 RepID=UPI0012D4102E|nr:uncharacterized protein LOC116337012 [Contarinia nasturtii]
MYFDVAIILSETMKQFLFAVFLSILIFDGVIKESMGQITFKRVINEFVDKVQPVTAANKNAAETEYNRLAALDTHSMQFLNAKKAFKKANKEIDRDWGHELTVLFKPYPVTDAVRTAFEPLTIPDQVKTHVQGLANLTSTKHKTAINKVINEIFGIQENLNTSCNQLLGNLQSDMGINSLIQSDIVYNSWHTEVLNSDLLTIITYNIPIMKRKNTWWRNRFGNLVTAVNSARNAFSGETDSIIQKLNNNADPNHVTSILKNYKKIQTTYKKALEKINQVVNEYFGLRYAFIDILMGDRTNCDLFRKTEKEKETLQLL